MFLVLALVLLWPVVIHPGWWIWTPGAEHSDLAVTHWPNAHFTRRMLWERGQFPVWRPTIMSGTPFAANPLAGLYYPPNWLFLFLPWPPLEVGLNLSALAHLWLAGAAMYALMRRGFGAGRWGALVAAVAYEAAPKLMAHLGTGHVGWVQAWGWLPVVVLLWIPSPEFWVPSSRSRILAGVALAMQFCADVRMAAYTVIVVATLVLAWTLNRNSESPLSNTRSPIPNTQSPISNLQSLIPNIRSLVLPSAIFLGLSACQWLPLVALMPETTRTGMTLRDAAVWSLPWRYLLGLLLANHGGFHEWMTYVGVSTLVLAGAGVGTLWRKRKARWLGGWLVGLLIGAAWFSLGENGGLFQVLWRIVPGLGLLRVPPRAWVVVVFAAAALAGFGVEGARRLRRWQQALTLAVGVFPPLLVAGYWLLVGVPPLNLVMFGLVTPLAAALVGLRSQRSGPRAGATLRLGNVKSETVFGLAAVLLVAIDLVVVDVTLVEARPPEDSFSVGRAAAEWLAAQPGHFRVYSPSYSIPQHVAERYGLALADGVDPLQLRAYADYLTRAAGLASRAYSVTLPPFPEGADVRTALADVTPDAELLGRLGVQYVASAFPIARDGDGDGDGNGDGDGPLHLEGRFDGVYVYRNGAFQPVANAERGDSIVLSDGTVLFRYSPWPVYAGWAVSVVTVVALIGFGSFRRR